MVFKWHYAFIDWVTLSFAKTKVLNYSFKLNLNLNPKIRF